MPGKKSSPAVSWPSNRHGVAWSGPGPHPGCRAARDRSARDPEEPGTAGLGPWLPGPGPAVTRAAPLGSDPLEVAEVEIPAQVGLDLLREEVDQGPSTLTPPRSEERVEDPRLPQLLEHDPDREVRIADDSRVPAEELGQEVIDPVVEFERRPRSRQRDGRHREGGLTPDRGARLIGDRPRR